MHKQTGDKMIKDVWYTDRPTIEKSSFGKNTAVISVCDPDKPCPKVDCPNHLIIPCYDFEDEEEAKYTCGDSYDPENMFGPNKADHIVKYIQQLPDNVSEIVLHCEAGISRSAGAALAIARETDALGTFELRYNVYNSLVYRSIRLAFFNRRMMT